LLKRRKRKKGLLRGKKKIKRREYGWGVAWRKENTVEKTCKIIRLLRTVRR
jgi:hypothetical protein